MSCMLTCSFVHSNDAEIMCTRNAQCNTKESPND